jgi:hypothetical protein
MSDERADATPAAGWKKTPPTATPSPQSSSAEPWKKEEPPSMLGGFFKQVLGRVTGGPTPEGKALETGAGYGLTEMGQGALQLGGKLLPPGAIKERFGADIAARRAAAEKAYEESPERQAHPVIAGAGRFAGEAAATAPLGVGGAGLRLGGRALLGAGQGALGGAIQSGGDPAATATGAAIGGPLGVVSHAIGPVLSAGMQKIATEFPTLYGMASGWFGKTPEAFQRATADEVLKSIGEKLPSTVKVGPDLVNHVGDKSVDAYDKVLPKVTFKATEPNPDNLDQTFLKTGLPPIADKVPEIHATDYERLIDGKNGLLKKLDGDGNMNGKDWKEFDSKIGGLAKRYSSYGATPDNRLYADALRDLQAEMRETLHIHNPIEAPELAKADEAWAKYVRLEEAAGRRVDSNSQFLPNDILMSTRKQAGNRRFSHGDDVLQKFGVAGNDLLSGKPTRWEKIIPELIGPVVGAALGHATAGPMGAVGGTVAGQLARPMIHDLAQSGVAAVARGRQTPLARKIGEAVSRVGGAASGAAAAAAKRDFDRQQAAERMKVSERIGELKHQAYIASRGNLTEYQKLNQQLADARKEYRDLGGTA